MESDNMKEIFRECLRNHAANLGSYATDGCGEFIPDETSAGGLQCAACGCHRNFHRKVLMVASAAAGDATILPGRSSSAAASESVKKRFRTKFSAEQKEKMLRFAEKIGWRLQKREDSDGDDDRDEEIEQFCREIGVSRQVFKVWLHNHRNSSSSSSSLTH